MSGIKVKSRKLFDVLELTAPKTVTSRVFSIFMLTLISSNVIAVMLETVESFGERYAGFFRYFELVSIIVFSLEFILRVWTCTSHPDYRHPILGRIRYIFSPMALIDLVAILPFYLPLLIPVDLRFMRALRLLRIFRLFKLGRYTNALRLVGTVLREKREELFITLFVVIILLVLSSSLMYSVEHEIQPEAFSSIPATMWWGVATLTTVGYGDVFPVSPLGKFLGAIISLLGIGMFALPAGILASGFAEAIRQEKEYNCPHCGKDIESKDIMSE